MRKHERSLSPQKAIQHAEIRAGSEEFQLVNQRFRKRPACVEASSAVIERAVAISRDRAFGCRNRVTKARIRQDNTRRGGRGKIDIVDADACAADNFARTWLRRQPSSSDHHSHAMGWLSPTSRDDGATA